VQISILAMTDPFEATFQALSAEGGNAYAVNWLLYPYLLFVWSSQERPAM